MPSNMEVKLESLYPDEERIPESQKLRTGLEQREYLISGEMRHWDGPLQEAVSPVCMPDTFPFTGRKDSAGGTLSVSNALRVFSVRTLVGAKHTDINKTLINQIVWQRTSRFLTTDFIL